MELGNWHMARNLSEIGAEERSFGRLEAPVLGLEREPTIKELVDLTVADIAIGGAEVIRRVEGPWRQLCEQTQSEAFYRPEWTAAYVRAFEQNSQVVLITASVGERLTGVLTLIRKWGLFAGMPIVRLKATANSHSVRFDILRARGSSGEMAIHAIWSALKRVPHWDLLELPMFSEEGACQQLIADACCDGYGTMTRLYSETPFLRMRTDSSGRLNWLAETSRNFRHELRRFARVLESQTGGTLKLVRRDQPNPEMLRQFFELEASGWKGRARSAIVSNAGTLAFYAGIARVAAELGQFRLYSLECGGTLVAGAFGLITGGCYYPMKIAYNESFHRGGPGHLLMNAILEDCAQRGISQVYFGGNKDRYKTLWTSKTRRHLTGHIFNLNFYPRFLYQLRTRVLPTLRRGYSCAWDRLWLKSEENSTLHDKTTSS